jgi:hypothetical protein
MGQFTSPSLLTNVTNPPPAGQVWSELHFVLPTLAAASSTAYRVALAPENATSTAHRFAWIDSSRPKADGAEYGEDSRELQLAGRPVVRYMHTKLDETTPAARQATYKPYHHVYDPSGKRYLTKGPGGVFPHHRGIFFGFNRISYGEGRKADTWHCRNGENQSHQAVVVEEAGPVLGRHRVTIHWNGQKQDTFAIETRELTAYQVPGGTLLEFASRLESQVGSVRLDGDPQHAGVQFRATQDVPDKTADQTYYLRPDGRGLAGKFRNWPGDKAHVNLPWNALSFVVDAQRYTCCFLDRPQNPKEARFSERNYGRFGSYFEYSLDTSRPLEVSYRFWLQAGEMEVADVERLAADFTQAVAVQVK